MSKTPDVSTLASDMVKLMHLSRYVLTTTSMHRMLFFFSSAHFFISPSVATVARGRLAKIHMLLEGDAPFDATTLNKTINISAVLASRSLLDFNAGANIDGGAFANLWLPPFC